MGVALVATTFLLILNFTQVKNITISLQPGIFGGILLLFLNILYLPNAAIATAAYFSGTGLAVGAGTIVSPWWYQLGQIPALPLLGILPTSRQPFALLGVLFFIALGVLLARWALAHGMQTLIQSYLFTIALATLLAYLGSGALLTAEMGAMGVSIWKFVLSIALEIGIGAAAILFLKPLIIKVSCAFQNQIFVGFIEFNPRSVVILFCIHFLIAQRSHESRIFIVEHEQIQYRKQIAVFGIGFVLLNDKRNHFTGVYF